MRSQLLRLNKKQSTKSERRIGEILKRNRIKFFFKKRIGKYEADFVIGKLILEIDGSVHNKNSIERDSFFVSQGYIPIHLMSKWKDTKTIEKEIIYLIQANNNVRFRQL